MYKTPILSFSVIFFSHPLYTNCTLKSYVVHTPHPLNPRPHAALSTHTYSIHLHNPPSAAPLIRTPYTSTILPLMLLRLLHQTLLLIRTHAAAFATPLSPSATHSAAFATILSPSLLPTLPTLLPSLLHYPTATPCASPFTTSLLTLVGNF